MPQFPLCKIGPWPRVRGTTMPGVDKQLSDATSLFPRGLLESWSYTQPACPGTTGVPKASANGPPNAPSCSGTPACQCRSHGQSSCVPGDWQDPRDAPLSLEERAQWASVCALHVRGLGSITGTTWSPDLEVTLKHRVRYSP